MKNYYLLISLFLLINFIGYAQDTLTILHLNDTHSTLSSVGPRNPDLSGTHGGISRAAGVISYTRFTESNVLTLHSGDAFIGDLFFNVYFGAAEFQLLNFLLLDAMAVGNHEWDLTPEILYGSLQASFTPDSGFPLLSANTILDDPEVQPLKNYIFPYSIKQVGNIRVGIFGMTTPETNIISQPSPAIIDTNIIQISSAMVDTLTSKNCDVIILLSHLGFILDQAVAANVSGINLILGGHDHYIVEPIPVINPSGQTTWISQAGSNYSDIMKLKLISGQNNFVWFERIHLDETINEPVAIKVQVDDLITGIEQIYGPVYTQQIATATERFKEAADSLMYPGNHDTPIGNIVTDAFRLKTGTDIAIEAGGSTAQPFYEGPLAAADAFRVVGYGFNTVNGLGFRLVTFDILGSDLWSALEMCLATIEANDEFLPQVSGMKYVYNPDKPRGSRLISVIIDNNTLNPTETYSVTGNEFLAQVLTSDLFQTPISNFFLYDSLTEFQVLAEYIAMQQTISPVIEGRIVADVSTDVQNENTHPDRFELKQNYPNPFNPVTNFSFVIGHSSLVTLKIYDVLGDEIAVVVNENLPEGSYSYRWNATGLASGMYIYKITAGNFVDSKKIILLR